MRQTQQWVARPELLKTKLPTSSCGLNSTGSSHFVTSDIKYQYMTRSGYFRMMEHFLNFVLLLSLG